MPRHGGGSIRSTASLVHLFPTRFDLGAAASNNRLYSFIVGTGVGSRGVQRGSLRSIPAGPKWETFTVGGGVNGPEISCSGQLNVVVNPSRTHPSRFVRPLDLSRGLQPDQDNCNHNEDDQNDNSQAYPL